MGGNRKYKDDYGKEVVAGYYLYSLQADSWLSPMMIMVKGLIIVYPNPFNATKGEIYITFNVDGLINPTALRIYDITGELIYETNEIYNGKAFWGCKNNFGEDVASGVISMLLLTTRDRRQQVRLE